MDGLFNNLKLDSNGRNILNAENGLTFCIQVGEESYSDLDNCTEQEKSRTLIEPTISVLESELETEEDEFVSHEIDADLIRYENNNCKVGGKNVGKAKGIDGYHFTKKNKRLWQTSQLLQDNSINKRNLNTSFNIKKKSQLFSNYKCKTYSKNGTKPNDLTSVILNNLSQEQNRNYTGMKVMVNQDTSKCVLKSSYKKSNGVESFTVEPWMKAVPKVLQNSKDRLFILNKDISRNSFVKQKSFLHSSSDTSDISSISLNTEKEFCHRQKIQLVKEENGEFKGNSEPSESADSKIIYWVEGNVDKITDFACLSESVKNSYAKSRKLENNSLEFEFSEYLANIPTYESPPVTQSGAAPGLNVYMSWEAVKKRIEEVQEETMTRFVFHYKTPTFKDDPVPFKRIYFELDTKRKDVDVIIPNKGIPFVFLGICVFSCHLGRKRSKTDYIQDLNRGVKTKKIGCPAIFTIIRIARFPDFDISDLNPSCQEAVLQEVKDAWDFDNSRVRYYIEYHVREPTLSDHKGHEVMELVNDNRYKESIDPRILDKVRSLTREGFYKMKLIREKVNQFVKDELVKGEDIPTRRRYNPSERDIRYMICKAREELKKEGKNIVQLECSALAKQISESVKNITEEGYLNQVKSCLGFLFKAINTQEPLESLFMINNMDSNNLPFASSSPLKRGPKKRKTEEMTSHISPVVAEVSKDNNLLVEADQFAVDQAAMDQFYVGVPDGSENAFCAQIYAQDFVDMNPGLVDSLHAAPEDGVAEVYCIPDVTYELTYLNR